MRFYRCICFCFYLFGVLSCRHENDNNDSANSLSHELPVTKTDSLRLQQAFIKRCGTLEITPVDESEKDTALLRFVTNLKAIIHQKDTAALMELIEHTTITSHGGGEVGKKDFIKHWQLEKNPFASPLWAKLDRAINPGGCFDVLENDSVFILPYLQAPHYFKNDCTFDWFNTYICLKASTIIYEKPNSKSKVLARLKYRVLGTANDSENINSFISVSNTDGTIKGYVHEDDVYLCADYMLVIGKQYGEWYIQSFSPFD